MEETEGLRVEPVQPVFPIDFYLRQFNIAMQPPKKKSKPEISFQHMLDDEIEKLNRK